MNIQIAGKVKLQGFFRFQTFVDNVCTKDTGQIPNLITDFGLDQFGQPQYVGAFSLRYITPFCYVGTGNTAPTFADTQLTSFLAMNTGSFTGLEGATSSTYTAGPPTFWSQIFKYTFATGVATGNLTEVGVGTGISAGSSTSVPPSGSYLFSHALILDGGGAPTTITVLSTEQLVVTYTLNMYPDTTDNTYSFPVNTTTYSGTFRLAQIATVPPFYFGGTNGNTYWSGNLSNATALGPTTGLPTGSTTAIGLVQSAGGITFSISSYSPGSLTRQATWTASQTTANVNITAIVLVTTIGEWQFSVSPAIPKTAGVSFQFTFAISWARY